MFMCVCSLAAYFMGSSIEAKQSSPCHHDVGSLLTKTWGRISAFGHFVKYARVDVSENRDTQDWLFPFGFRSTNLNRVPSKHTHTQAQHRTYIHIALYLYIHHIYIYMYIQIWICVCKYVQICTASHGGYNEAPSAEPRQKRTLWSDVRDQHLESRESKSTPQSVRSRPASFSVHL